MRFVCAVAGSAHNNSAHSLQYDAARHKNHARHNTQTVLQQWLPTPRQCDLTHSCSCQGKVTVAAVADNADGVLPLLLTQADSRIRNSTTQPTQEGRVITPTQQTPTHVIPRDSFGIIPRLARANASIAPKLMTQPGWCAVTSPSLHTPNLPQVRKRPS
jgi:hypothetical protein